MTSILTVAEKWIEDVSLSPETLERYAYSLERLGENGLREVEQVTAPEWRRYAARRREQGVSPTTINRDLAAISSLLRWLWERGEFELKTLLELRELYFEQPPLPPPDFLSPQNYLKLRLAARGISPRLDLAIMLAVNTGVRAKELRHLHYEDFFFVQPHPWLAVTRTHGREIKTKVSRTVPLAKGFVRELMELGFPTKEGPVFVARSRRDTDGIYVHGTTFKSWLREARQDAGLYANWVTFRHTFASWHVQEGTSIAKVAKWLGHSLRICFNHYASLIPGGDPDIEWGFKKLRSLEG